MGHEQTQRDVKLLTAAMKREGISAHNGFMAALSPGAAARHTDLYYNDERAQLDAFADAMHEEYKIITDAGLTVQFDAPDMPRLGIKSIPSPRSRSSRTGSSYVSMRRTAH
ncbi:hypothetical protein [Trueperella pecoris]|uniref:hypothetical protein n=1 Tax=Trueperella pecoris TaxID=2733571 RepID=UPI00210005EB|nr:hypothetical protein [Trueperella pecoris]